MTDIERACTLARKSIFVMQGSAYGRPKDTNGGRCFRLHENASFAENFRILTYTAQASGPLVGSCNWVFSPTLDADTPLRLLESHLNNSLNIPCFIMTGGRCAGAICLRISKVCRFDANREKHKFLCGLPVTDQLHDGVPI